VKFPFPATLISPMVNSKSLLERLEQLNVVQYATTIIVLISVSMALSFGIEELLISFGLNLEQGSDPSIVSHGKIITFVAVCIAAPIFETFFAQAIPIKLTRKHLSTTGAILLSAAIFSLMHWYNVAYMIRTFLIGIVLAFGYAFWNKRDVIHPFWLICFIHATINLIVFLVKNT
jgi:membrane protease YdiL (CAAX protease family)